MKTLNETIEEIKAGGVWNVMNEVLFYLDQFRSADAEIKRLRESVTGLTDAMASYRYSWGEMYNEKFGHYPDYPF